jgi:hypothetical protein
MKHQVLEKRHFGQRPVLHLTFNYNNTDRWALQMLISDNLIPPKTREIDTNFGGETTRCRSRQQKRSHHALNFLKHLIDNLEPTQPLSVGEDLARFLRHLESVDPMDSVIPGSTPD